MDSAKHIIADQKLVIEGYRSMAEVFDRELLKQTQRLQEAEQHSQRQDRKIQYLQQIVHSLTMELMEGNDAQSA
jgi:hypothetical protein